MWSLLPSIFNTLYVRLFEQTCSQPYLLVCIHAVAHTESGDTALQLQVLKERVSSLESENDDLRAELNAFDPAFFEEIEDLKHDHYQLSQKCAAQERTIQQLRQQLAMPPLNVSY